MDIHSQVLWSKSGHESFAWHIDYGVSPIFNYPVAYARAHFLLTNALWTSNCRRQYVQLPQMQEWRVLSLLASCWNRITQILAMMLLKVDFTCIICLCFAGDSRFCFMIVHTPFPCVNRRICWHGQGRNYWSIESHQNCTDWCCQVSWNSREANHFLSISWI